MGPAQIGIVYKDFGVKLVVTPTIMGEGNVETVIAPEVSDLDFQDGVNINGFTVPALKTSRLSTDVVTKDGESIVMGGLLRHQESLREVIESISSVTPVAWMSWVVTPIVPASAMAIPAMP